MGSISAAFNIATGALEADQAALNIVANNTANASTPGYTRETPVWQENDSVLLNGVQFGMGATVQQAQSQRSLVLEKAVQQQTQAESASATRLTALQQIQALFSGAAGAGTASSAATGIGSDLSSLFDAFASLEGGASDVALREQVLSAAGTLASDFNAAALQLQNQSRSLDQQGNSILTQANSLLQDIAQLNVQIQSNNPASDAGTLEDQRQQDLTNLSQLIGIRTISTENNGLTVTTTDGALLVAEGQTSQITAGQSGGVTHFYDSAGNDITAQLTTGGGQLGGVLEARDQDLPQVQAQLDQLAFAVATQVNQQNGSGADLNGNVGAAIFSVPASLSTADPAGAAAALAVSMTDPAGIAAAASGQGSSNNANAVALANLRNSSVAGGTTATSFFSDFVTTLGSLVSEVSSENTAQGAALTQLQNQIGSISGVDLNEEAAQLETLEESYQAASKLFTILTQVMTSALNLGVETSYA